MVQLYCIFFFSFSYLVTLPAQPSQSCHQHKISFTLPLYRGQSYENRVLLFDGKILVGKTGIPKTVTSPGRKYSHYYLTSSVAHKGFHERLEV